MVNIPANPPEKNPIHMPGPPKNGVSKKVHIKAPPNTTAAKDFFETGG